MITIFLYPLRRKSGDLFLTSWMRVCPAGHPSVKSCGRFLEGRRPGTAVRHGGLSGTVPAHLGFVPAAGARSDQVYQLPGTGTVPVLSAVVRSPLPADWLEEFTGRYLGVDLDISNFCQNGGGAADAVLRRTVRVGMCPCKLGAVAADRAGNFPLAGCCLCPWPACFYMALCPCSASGCRGQRDFGRPPLLDFAESGAADPAPYIGLADGSPRRGVLPAGCCWNHPIPRGIAPLLPAPDGRRRFLCSALSM